MNVNQIKAGIRYSKDTGNGWKCIELGAEASVDIEEDWATAQQGLYAMLAQQLRGLWGQQNGQNSEHGQNEAERPKEASWAEIESYGPRLVLTARSIGAKNITLTFGAMRRTAGSGIATRRARNGAGREDD